MDKNVGKSPDRVENADWQGRPKLDAKGVSDDFALASAGQAMSSSAETAKDEPGLLTFIRTLGHISVEAGQHRKAAGAMPWRMI